MRFVVYGAGAIGGVVAARLQLSDHDVVVIARGPHLHAITTGGLRLDRPDGSAVVAARAVDHPARVDWTDDDVVLLCVKSQDTQRALIDLEATAPEDVRLVCLQNGVANEPAALRRFANVYGANVMVPAAFLESGVVTAYSTPVPGIIDVGRFPRGVDDVAREVRSALARAGFSSQPIGEIRRWKYRKLLSNLGNTAQALLVAGDDVTRVTRIAVAEGEATLAAAGVDVAGRNEDARRRADWIRLAPVDGRPRPGGSTWQSLRRGAGTVEADYLNGEIVLLGRLHGVATPCNALLRRRAVQAAAAGSAPALMEAGELLALLEQQAT